MKYFAVAFLMIVIGCSQEKKTSASYDAGVTFVHTSDTSRIFKPGTDLTDALHHRPIDLDIWYPAYHAEADTQLLVRDLFRLLETRANYYSGSKVGDGISGQFAQFFCTTFKCADSTSLLRFKTNSFKNAAAASGRFPIVVYMTAFNGMSYENFSMFESLAQKGFVVVSISSIGRFPGDMTTKKEDLMEQVYDAVAAVKELKKNPNADTNRIAIVGYSWGGLSGAILAGKLPNVKCMVSLEGSEFHHYGNEDMDFEAIKNSDDFKNLQFSIPYLRMESSPSNGSGKKDSVYDFVSDHVKEAHIFTIDSMQHEDFDCFSLVVKKAGNCPVNQRYHSALQLTVGFLETELKGKGNFLPAVDALMNKTIRKK